MRRLECHVVSFIAPSVFLLSLPLCLPYHPPFFPLIPSSHRLPVLPGLYAGLNPAIVGIAPYMGLNFAIYDSVKSLSESPMFVFNRNSPSKPAMSQKDDSRGQMLRALGTL